MDVDELAGVATAALVQRLGSGIADPLVTVVSRRLQFSYIGKRVLAGLRLNPTSAWQRELTTSVIADELSRGPVFERALTEALGRVSERVRRHGRDKRFRLGPVRFGWLGVVIAVLVVLLMLAAADLVATRSHKGVSTGGPVSGSQTGIHGLPLDLDKPRDQVGDIVFGSAGIAAIGKSTLGPRPFGTALAGDACAKAIGAYGKPSIPTVSVGDVICVSTSRGGVAAVTLAGQDRVTWLYWPPSWT
jgi:hypothetical protein